MIVRDRAFSRWSATAALTACAVLGWAGLSTPMVSARAEAEPAVGERDVAQDPEIRVVRQIPEPEWEAAVDQKLARSIGWAEEQRVESFLRWFGEQTGLEVALDDSMREELDPDTTIRPMHGAIPARTALDVLVWTISRDGPDAVWWTAPGGIVVGEPHSQRRPIDLRFYDVRPLLEQWRRLMSHTDGSLEDYFHDLAGPQVRDELDLEGRSVGLWDGQLLVRLGDASHDIVFELLQQLSTGRDPASTRVPAQLREQLAKPIRYESTTTQAAALAELAAAEGLPLWFDPEILDGDDRQFGFRDESLGSALTAIADGLPFSIHHGVVVLSRATPLVQRAYEVSDFLLVTDTEVRAGFSDYVEDEGGSVEEFRAELREQRVERLCDLLRNHVAPNTWDEFDASHVVWGNLLLIRQVEPAHDSIESFLETARRAFAD